MPLQSIAPGNSWIGGRFFEGLQGYMENKNKGNENKIILEDFNCTVDKMDWDGEHKTQSLYWCCSRYALSKLMVDNGIEDLWKGRTQITLSSATTSFFIKSAKNNHPPVSDWWEYTKHRFKREC